MRRRPTPLSSATRWTAPVPLESTGTTANITLGTFVSPDALCPDLLRYEQIGAADGWRGRVVRALFFMLRAWPLPKRG